MQRYMYIRIDRGRDGEIDRRTETDRETERTGDSVSVDELRPNLSREINNNHVRHDLFSVSQPLARLSDLTSSEGPGEELEARR